VAPEENNPDDPILHLQTLLEQHANPKTKAWWEKYMRQVIPFRGVGILVIREQAAAWREGQNMREGQNISTWDKYAQLEVALRLFEFPHAEDKLAGILFLQNYLYDQFAWTFLLEKYASLYQDGLIFDWNICDWFCVRVLGETIARQGLPCAQAIAAWSDAANIWQARSAVVAFIPVTTVSQYHPLIYQTCARLLQREERFAKTAVGWILHDLSRLDEAGVRHFVEQNLRCFSVESLKNALKYFDEAERKEYLQKLKR
jgi:3-methyladenine DNA glycosylase AlkD